MPVSRFQKFLHTDDFLFYRIRTEKTFGNFRTIVFLNSVRHTYMHSGHRICSLHLTATKEHACQHTRTDIFYLLLHKLLFLFKFVGERIREIGFFGTTLLIGFGIHLESDGSTVHKVLVSHVVLCMVFAVQGHGRDITFVVSVIWSGDGYCLSISRCSFICLK